MNCSKCGNSLKPGAKFCPKCGTLVEEMTGASVTPFEPVRPYTEPAMTAPAFEKKDVAGLPFDVNCDRCGTLVHAGKKFCSKCGRMVSDMVFPNPEPVPAAAHICPQCSTPFDDRYCPECGWDSQAAAGSVTPVVPVPPPRVDRCPNCGAYVDEDDLFCTECSTRIVRSTDAVPGPVPPTPPVTDGTAVPAPKPSKLEKTVEPEYVAPGIVPLKTNRKLWKYILFSAITFGIYSIIFWNGIAKDLNTAETRYDGKKTTNYWLVTLLLSWLTFGIFPIVWSTMLCGRLGGAQLRRGLNKTVSCATFWVWDVLLAFTIVCPILYIHKVAKAINGICRDYNAKGC